MRATLIAALKTPMTLHDVLWAFRAAYERLEGVPPTADCLAILVGQSDFETASWKSMYCYNFPNSKASDSYEGYYCQYPCGEIIDGREQKFRPPHPQCNFRAYLTAPDGAAAALGLIRKLWPVAWSRAKAGDLEGYCRSLVTERGANPEKRDGGEFFTADLGHYTRGLRARAMKALEQLRITPALLTSPLLPQSDPPAPREQRPTLRQGDRGDLYPKELQRLLNIAGAVPPLTVDGDFGAKTKGAVLRFQRDAGLEADGVVGPATWAALLDRSPDTERHS